MVNRNKTDMTPDASVAKRDAMKLAAVVLLLIVSSFGDCKTMHDVKACKDNMKNKCIGRCIEKIPPQLRSAIARCYDIRDRSGREFDACMIDAGIFVETTSCHAEPHHFHNKTTNAIARHKRANRRMVRDHSDLPMPLKQFKECKRNCWNEEPKCDLGCGPASNAVKVAIRACKQQQHDNFNPYLDFETCLKRVFIYY